MFSLHDTRCLAQDTQDLAYPASEILPRYSRSCRDTRGLVEILEVLSRYSSLVKIDYSSLAQDTRGTRLPVSVIKTLLTKSKTEQTPQNKSKKPTNYTMMLNKKMLLVLALAMTSLVTGSPGSVRKLKKKKDRAVTLKHHAKAKDTDVEEVDLDLKLLTCKKGSKECDDIVGDDEAKEVSMAMFAATMADDMVDALDEDDDGDRRKLDRELYYCYYYYYCGYYCYYRYVCY